ncbi:MAG: hypothetical protein ACP5I3_06740 [Thermoproteus sp.]
MDDCACIAMLVPCDETLVGSALKAGACSARCEGGALVLVWPKGKEMPCSVKCALWQTGGRSELVERCPT